MTAIARATLVGLIGLSPFGLGACVRVQARMPPAPVGLDVPPAPSRVPVPVVLAEPEETPPPAPAPIAAPVAPPRAANTPAPNRPAERPTAPSVTTPAPEAAPGPVLQTTPNTGAVEQNTRDLLSQAKTNLDRVRRQDLGTQAKAQFDSAVSFMRIAERALQIKNYMYAQQAAVKAAAVARELVKG